jgi:hypothetical protein
MILKIVFFWTLVISLIAAIHWWLRRCDKRHMDEHGKEGK